RVVALVTGVFVDRLRRSRQGQLALPRPRKRGRVVDFELVEQRIGIQKPEPLDEVKVTVPTKVAAGIAIKPAAIIEVRRVDDERVALPVSDRITDPQPNR